MPRLHGDEGRRGVRRPQAEVVEARELELDAVVALLAHEGDAVLGHIVEDEGRMAVDELVREGELAVGSCGKSRGGLFRR